MRGRALWFVAGSAAGVYASAKARRLAYRVSMPGLVDQAAALGTGWRAFSQEMRDGMDAAEHRLADSLGAAALEPGAEPAAQLPGLPAAPHDHPELTIERDLP